MISRRACVCHQRYSHAVLSRAPRPNEGSRSAQPQSESVSGGFCARAPQSSGEPAKRKSGRKPTRKADYHQRDTAGKAGL